ncbi:hypothetical protein DAEQUDRAFT_361722 [Daedalea quercina L-15889]|uniref:Uncharacterized protein n=1 Tax=Daedalea quercina L-15889 TaxID=1314783 RepID=A0A165TTR8_9APHY|nr:hypothetical protein DAEQUDRAFT_361722 [Daedalea quercina L-15889]
MGIRAFAHSAGVHASRECTRSQTRRIITVRSQCPQDLTSMTASRRQLKPVDNFKDIQSISLRHMLRGSVALLSQVISLALVRSLHISVEVVCCHKSKACYCAAWSREVGWHGSLGLVQ